jgi:nucleotide-binding universal stress UspA family protein
MVSRRGYVPMVAVKNILVPIDFSETSPRVLEFGRTLADACGASLHLLHVIGHPMHDGEVIGPQRDDACRRLEALLDRRDREARHATTYCEVGTPANVIVSYAAEHEIDLIVMGTHWHAPTCHVAVGSIAESVLGLAPCAVLAVKAETCEDASAFDPAPAATNV